MMLSTIAAIAAVTGVSLISFFFGMLFYRFMHKRVKRRVDHQRLIHPHPRRRRSGPRA